MVKSEEPCGTLQKLALCSSVIIMALALVVSLYTACYMFCPGKVLLPKPSGYGIIRGIGPFPSDHIVIPTEWKNKGGRPVSIRHPYLVLHELGPDGNENGKVYCFFLAGEYPTISTNSFDEFYNIKDSFILEPHSITPKNLVFHIKDWWDKDATFYEFEFNTSNVSYSVDCGYQKDLDWQPKVKLFDKMEIYPTVNNLTNRSEGYYWDYFYVNQSACNQSVSGHYN